MYKSCKCGAEYTKFEWGQLEHCGSQHYDEEDGSLVNLLMRHCSKCGSTLAVPVVIDCIQ